MAPLNPPPTSSPFGLSLSATLARRPLTVVAQVHMCSPYPLPSHHPACGCQEDRFLTVPIPRACARFCTLSGPLFIQAPRFTRWYGWSHLLTARGTTPYIKRHRVAVTGLAVSGGNRAVFLRFPSARLPGLYGPIDPSDTIRYHPHHLFEFIHLLEIPLQIVQHCQTHCRSNRAFD